MNPEIPDDPLRDLSLYGLVNNCLDIADKAEWVARQAKAIVQAPDRVQAVVELLEALEHFEHTAQDALGNRTYRMANAQLLVERAIERED